MNAISILGGNMPHQVLVPPLGQTVDTVTLVTWYKHEGDAVREGEALFAIETDKAVLDIEAQASGILSQVSAAEGDAVEVLKAVAVIVASGKDGAVEDISEPPPSRAAGEFTPSESVAEVSVRTSPRVAPEGERRFVSPRARRLAEAKGVPLEALTGTGPEGAIIERDVRAYVASATPRDAAPLGSARERR